METTPAARAMVMGASSRSRRTASARWAFVATVVVGLLTAACGSSATLRHAGGRVDAGTLGSLRRVAAPSDWVHSRLGVGGAVLSAPPTWHRVSGDPGSATFELGRDAGRPIGYLNATPATSAERLGSWAAFRLSHNRDEGDRHVRLIAARGRVHLGANTIAACLQDAYSTSTARYIEIACLARTPRTRTVIVVASPVQSWNHERAVLSRAVDAIA
jgi:hypothetical protein